MEQLEGTDMQDDLKKRTLHIISEQKRVYDFSMGVKNKTPPQKLGNFYMLLIKVHLNYLKIVYRN